MNGWIVPNQREHIHTVTTSRKHTLFQIKGSPAKNTLGNLFFKIPSIPVDIYFWLWLFMSKQG